MSKYIKLEDAIEAVTSIFRVSALFGGINDDENMWREKAEKVLAKCEVTDITKQGLEHIEASEDCISKEYVLDKLNEQYKVNRFEEHNDMANIGINQAESIVQDAPSVVPQEKE